MGIVVGFAFILHISNISRVGISHIVSHDLRTAIGKGNTISTIGSVAITGFVLAKVGTRVFIGNTVFVGIGSWGVIRWLMVGGGRLVIDGGRLVNRGRVVHRSWMVRCRPVN